jgi:uncharacterized protein HemY
MPDRLDQIRRLLAVDPQDVFLHYSLGMELCKAERWNEALGAFARCEELDADYLPARIETGKALRAAGRLTEARATFETALVLAETRDETHARDFIRQQLDSLPQGA